MNQELRGPQGTRYSNETKELLGNVRDRNDRPSEWKLIMTATGSPGHNNRMSTLWSAGQVETVYNQVYNL
jgi:hypothetical protein